MDLLPHAVDVDVKVGDNFQLSSHSWFHAVASLRHRLLLIEPPLPYLGQRDAFVSADCCCIRFIVLIVAETNWSASIVRWGGTDCSGLHLGKYRRRQARDGRGKDPEAHRMQSDADHLHLRLSSSCSSRCAARHRSCAMRNLKQTFSVRGRLKYSMRKDCGASAFN